ncbi:TPA: hypothetical protein MEA99_002527 [Klebsiella aerogenes]|nr:hypothetical protein [Klebsiella aerogenes]
MAVDEEKIKNAFGNKKYTWRTIRGVAKETGLDPMIVTKYIMTHEDEIVKSSMPNEKGETLFTSRLNRRSQSPWVRIISAVKNRGG